MSIEYKVTRNGLRIETSPKGVLDSQAANEYFSRLLNDDRIKENATEIVDFSHVTDFQISHRESSDLAASYQQPKTARLIDRTVFVCETELAYGIGRMLQTYHQIANPEHEVVVVRSETELEEKKLGSDPDSST